MDLNSWYRTESSGVVAYKAWNLESSGIVRHCFTTRIGGVSDPPFDTLNMGLHVSDDPARVVENRTRAARSLGLDPSMLTTAEQIHGYEVAVVTNEDAGHGAVDFAGTIPGVDALITNSSAPVLTLFYADCVPVLILDPVHLAVAVVHAGWKGTVKRITAEAVTAMRCEFGTEPADCLAAIGPSIGRCCYDVSREVALAINDATGDDRVIARASQDQWRLDLKLANWSTLRSTGIPETHIAVSQHCTACNPDEFFSYRRDGATGRMAAIISLSAP